MSQEWSLRKGHYPSAEGGDDGWYYICNAKGQADVVMEADAELAKQIVAALNNFVPNLEQKFKGLVQEWKEETLIESSSTKKILSIPYQKIIGLGPAVVPLLLEELAARPDHYHWALFVITGENPVHPEDRGDLEMIRYQWLRWGEKKGLFNYGEPYADPFAG